MSTLVTSVTPMLVMDVAPVANNVVAVSGIERSMPASIIHNTAQQQYSNGTAVQLQNQQQQMISASTHLLQPPYANGPQFTYSTGNYTIAARNNTLQSQHQQLHLNAMQQQQLMSGIPTPMAYHQQQQQCSMTQVAASSTSTSSHQQSTTTVPATTTTSTSINRSQRCGVCRGCQCKPCGTCTYCQDSPQFGGPGVKKQSCIERRCLRVLENRLQRDAPTFKARVGCNNCDDCKMPDCQICLVCLDRRFFNNRYMSGALCAKKRCNNATSLELPSQSTNNNNSNSTDRNHQLKRSYENNHEQIITKRRGMDSMHHMQAEQYSHQKLGQHKNGVDVKQLSINFNNRIPTSSPSSTSPLSNCSQQQMSQTPTKKIGINKDSLTQQQRQQHLVHQTPQVQEDQKYGYRTMFNGAPLPENGSTDNYHNTTNVYTTSSIPTTTATTIQTVCGNALIQQHLPPQNGNFYVASTASPFFNNTNNNNIHQQFDMTAAAAAATAVGLPPNHYIYQHQQQQQQQLQAQLCCNNYMQQQKFCNYPKYEYYDEHIAYGGMQNVLRHGVPPPDLFVPPSYSEMKNAVVLQPL